MRVALPGISFLACFFFYKVGGVLVFFVVIFILGFSAHFNGPRPRPQSVCVVSLWLARLSHFVFFVSSTLLACSTTPGSPFIFGFHLIFLPRLPLQRSFFPEKVSRKKKHTNHEELNKNRTQAGRQTGKNLSRANQKC